AGKRGFSIEPFLLLDGKLRTWADVRTTRRLEDDVLPIPTVRWEVDSVALEITAFATPQRESSAVFGRYRLKNESPRPRRATLYLALRPFQVNPPAQFLNTQGGVSPIHRLALEGRRVRVGADRDVLSLTQADGFGATTFDQGNVVDWLRGDRLPPETAVIDSFGFASGALAYRIELEPGASREVDLLIPLRGRSPAGEISDVEGSFRRARDAWRQALGTVGIELPDSAAAIAHAVRAQLGFIMVNRDGPSIQPGSRAYERSWIRDGSLTCSALLRFGHSEMVRDFIEWFGPHQYENGKIPCCADHRGADPVPEHDSHGEFIYLVAEYFRFTSDRASLERWWPRVAKAAAYMDTLRAQRRTPEYLAPEKKEFYGLLPPSISHEGYSAKPMHSYWDDLFALRGYKDAVYLAGVLGRAGDRARLERSRDQFFRDLNASIDAAMKKHKIPYIPGCADLGDYDATSTTIALSPVQAWPSTDERLVRTFAGYWDWFTKRRNGTEPWEAYTPYEWRTVGAFVRLGQRERAQQALDWFMRHQRPSGWRQWPEVVWRDERAPKFIGDLPHTWVGSDFVR
ncbi:MAG TPA: coagulation factor 5/8 type domain-containing protein, partial [Candidatus Eisenbacteria bacterium]|nr:coagulation factor 5/8 type domain-containing protein [Candidatus Eisenbacteria bacterium]